MTLFISTAIEKWFNALYILLQVSFLFKHIDGYTGPVQSDPDLPDSDIQLDPDLPGPDLPEPRFTGRINFLPIYEINGI